MIVALSIILSGIVVNNLSFALFCFIFIGKPEKLEGKEAGIYFIWCLLPFSMFAFLIYVLLYALIYVPIKRRKKKKIKEEEKCTERQK